MIINILIFQFLLHQIIRSLKYLVYSYENYYYKLSWLCIIRSLTIRTVTTEPSLTTMWIGLYVRHGRRRSNCGAKWRTPDVARRRCRRSLALTQIVYTYLPCSTSFVSLSLRFFPPGVSATRSFLPGVSWSERIIDRWPKIHQVGSRTYFLPPPSSPSPTPPSIVRRSG